MNELDRMDAVAASWRIVKASADRDAPLLGSAAKRPR